MLTGLIDWRYGATVIPDCFISMNVKSIGAGTKAGFIAAISPPRDILDRQSPGSPVKKAMDYTWPASLIDPPL